MEKSIMVRRDPRGCARVPRSGLRPIAELLATICSVVLLASGCGAGVSRTDQARRDADPRALEFLLEAQQAFEDGLYNYALVLVDSAANRAPELADVSFMRGRVLAAMRQYGAAQAAYEQTLTLDPDYPGVYHNLGNSAYLRGETQAALALYRRERGAAETASHLVQMGRAYADLGLTDSARWAYERALAADSANPTAHMWLGQLAEDAGEMDEAVRHSKRGLSLRPDNANYAYAVGVQLLRSGDLAGAAEMLSIAAERMPWHYAAHYNLGQALLGLGREEEGASNLARADLLLEHRKEIDEWERLVDANSHEPMLWVNYGNSLGRAGRVDEAIEALTIAYSLQPQWLELQNNIANLLLMRGDTSAALNRYEMLLEIDTTQADVWLNLGTVYALTGNLDAARAAWNAALRHEPEHPEAGRYLAELP